MSAQHLIDDVIAAHGGGARWEAVNRVDIQFSAGGLAFASRTIGSNALRATKASFNPHRMAGAFHNFGSSHRRGEFSKTGLRLFDEWGDVLLERGGGRRRFARLSRQFRWDDGDLLYFVSYAMWNYVCFPFFLATDAVIAAAASRWRGAGWKLDVQFNPRFATHSARQSFFFNSSLQLLRHAYCADVIGPYARALHHCEDYAWASGFGLARRRRVAPRLLGACSLPAPTLVWIKIEDVRYEMEACA